MKGLIYKELITARVILLCGLFINAFLWFALICMSFDTVRSVMPFQLIMVFMCVFGYVMLSMCLPEVFRADESRKLWLNFAAASPQGLGGQMIVKYIVMLGTYTASFLGWLAACGIAAGVFGTSFEPDGIFAVYCLFLILTAFEMPFVVRFGMDKGLAIKMAFVGVLLFIVIVYALFGDISFITDGFNAESFMAFISNDTLNTAKTVTMIAAFPAFALSCLVSIVLYRKGAENYDQ